MTCRLRGRPSGMRAGWHDAEGELACKHHKPEEIVAELRQVEVLSGRGKPLAEAVRAIGVTEATDYRWRAEYGGLKLAQVRRLKLLEQENGSAAPCGL